MAIGTGYRIMQYASNTPGTGDVEFSMGTDGGVAPYGYQPFDSLSGRSVCYYMENFDDRDVPTTGDWEIGVAPIAYDTNHFELQRSDTGAQIFESSNAGAAVNFSGTIRVNNIFPAQELGYLEGTNNLSDVSSVATSKVNLELGDVADMDDGDPDADKLDGKHASELWRLVEDATLSGDLTHEGNLSLSGDNDYTGKNNFSDGALILPVGADKWATS